ncbi:MAG: NAD(P)/FAD-dependent oxidoreductase [Ardenticatenaceae bacterium]|nr:NAD(P)/FAD-dependent oxidoreductase [Ardenticatenaceae bacterium]
MMNSTTTPPLPQYETAVIGAGFGGLGMGIRLKMAGRNSFIIFERAAELGGTWRDNTYPGCACDIPSIVYSFSFDQNPNWSRKFPTQPELLAYLKACAEKFDVRSHIRFQTNVNHLAFNEKEGMWTIQTADGYTTTARYVVSAMGPLNRPHVPRLKGFELFSGLSFHSSKWPQTFDPAGRRIAVIGTGASAIQFIPQIAKTAAQVDVYQRTPPWILPRSDEPVSPTRQKWFKRFPFLQQLARSRAYWLLEIGVLAFLGNEAMNRAAEKQARNHIDASIADPQLREIVTPNYQFGCKRALISDDYYPALQQENVTLLTDPIEEITSTGVLPKNRPERPVDTIIFGTGFVASEFLLDMKIFGRDNRELFGEWQQTGPEAYYGTAVSGYPNLFFLLGPNTGLGHNSVVLMIEAQYNYILDYINALEKKGRLFLDVKSQVQEEHNRQIQQKLKSTVWQDGGCVSWYQMENGKNTTLWPGSTLHYHRKMKRWHHKSYE